MISAPRSMAWFNDAYKHRPCDSTVLVIEECSLTCTVVWSVTNNACVQPPWLEFGRLRLGSKKVLPLEVNNDTDDIQVRS